MTTTPRPRAAVLVALIVLVVGLGARFPGALPGPRVVSALDHLTVHPLFQEAGSDDRGRVHHPHLSDPALQFAALDQRTTEALRAGRAPLWNPDLYGGAPLLGDGQSRPLSPVTLLRAVLPDQPGIAQDLGVTWLFTWCVLGATLLVRRIAAAPLPALAVAAAAALTTPYLSVWLLHPHASTFVWLPWCLLAIEAHSVLGVALAVFGLWTGGHPGTTLHVAGLSACWWLARSRRPAPVAGAVVGLLLAAPLWAPLWEQVQRSTTATARVGGALEPQLLLDLLWPGYWGHPATETWTGPGSWADGQLHPGLATMVLGVVGLLAPGPHRRLRVGLLGLLALATAGSVTGLPGPVAHSRLGSVAALFWVPLATLGTAAWARRAPRSAWLAAPMVLLTGTFARWHDQHSLSAEEHTRAPAAWVSTVKAAQEDGRILGIGWAAQPNTGALAGLRDLRGYDLPISSATHTLMGTLSSRPRGPWYPIDTVPDPAWLHWWDVRAVLAFPSDAEATGARLEAAGWTPLVFPNGAPLVGWKAPAASGCCWLASRTRVVRDARAALAGLSMDRSVVPVGPGGPSLDHPSAAVPAGRAWDGASRMVLTFPPQDHDTVLVVPEAWAPGWRARLSSGSPAAPVQLGTLAIGVPIPAGTTRAELYYRPHGWILGQRLFLGGLVLGLVVLGWQRRRRGQPDDRPVPATMPDGGKKRPHTASSANRTAEIPVGQGDGK